MGTYELFELEPVIRVLTTLFGNEGFWLPLVDMVYGDVEEVFVSVYGNYI